MDIVKNVLNLELISFEEYKIKVYSLIIIIFIFLITRLLLWLIKKALHRRNKSHNLDPGSTYALFQIVKYIIWVLAISFMFKALKIDLTVLLAGSAALLVGVGLGLQQTFNDVVSGIILLSEKSIKINDILEIDGDIVKIQEIGLRTSMGLNRDEISIIIPNSLITTNKVINWSHQSKQTRFKINVGVAYGSDVDLVMRIMKVSALEHPEVSDKTTVDARFLDFGSSSLDFQLLFYSENIFRIERVKSEIRVIINRKFIENDIIIPFPQLDLHFKTGKPEMPTDTE
ncbi:MAG: mechanosensitive ion channel [Paludibacter sp.]|nr:mechanosensitive ion channel [Paludibacter sp.]